jgi:hypothetical protein
LILHVEIDLTVGLGGGIRRLRQADLLSVQFRSSYTPSMSMHQGERLQHAIQNCGEFLFRHASNKVRSPQIFGLA